jgi:hypothetical protein
MNAPVRRKTTLERIRLEAIRRVSFPEIERKEPQMQNLNVMIINISIMNDKRNEKTNSRPECIHIVIVHPEKSENNEPEKVCSLVFRRLGSFKNSIMLIPLHHHLSDVQSKSRHAVFRDVFSRIVWLVWSCPPFIDIPRRCQVIVI